MNKIQSYLELKDLDQRNQLKTIEYSISRIIPSIREKSISFALEVLQKFSGK
jgi:hypothetical protein